MESGNVGDEALIVTIIWRRVFHQQLIVLDYFLILFIVLDYIFNIFQFISFVKPVEFKELFFCFRNPSYTFLIARQNVNKTLERKMC